MVIGNGSAKNCYDAAKSGNHPSRDQMQQCDRALSEEALSPHDAMATHVNRGVLRVRIGKTEEGIRDFDIATAMDPNEPEAYLNKGSALVRSGQAREALPLFTMALDKETRKPAYAYYGRGVAYEALGEIKSAYLDYQRASVADPKWDKPREELTRFTVKRP
jgi:tetratricopeptide (TPR) repeat protein